MPPVDPSVRLIGASPAFDVLAATSTGEIVGVVAAVVAAALVGVLVGALVTRGRRPPVDDGVADARIAAVWAGTRPVPTPPAETAVPPTVLALTVWRLPPNQVLGLVLDALGDLGLVLVEVTGDRAVLSTTPADPTVAIATSMPTVAIATYTSAVAIDGAGEGLHVQVELSGPRAPALADALRRRLVVASPSGGPVALLQDRSVRAPAGDARR